MVRFAVPRVIHFEIPADIAERAVKFYSEVFGWKMQKWDGSEDYSLAATGEEHQPGIYGAITKRTNLTSSTTNTIDVSSVDEYAAKITKNGGKVLTPKTPVPGVGYFAYCQDTEGDIFGMIQNDESAK